MVLESMQGLFRRCGRGPKTWKTYEKIRQLIPVSILSNLQFLLNSYFVVSNRFAVGSISSVIRWT